MMRRRYILTPRNDAKPRSSVRHTLIQQPKLLRTLDQHTPPLSQLVHSCCNLVLFDTRR